MQAMSLDGKNHPLIFGHRGVPQEYQENTLEGFQRAIALGLAGVELDVFLTKDQQLVVFHDVETKRLTGVTGKITEMTWAEIRQLDIQPILNVGKRAIDYGRSAKIPLLEEVLEEVRGKLRVDIELKASKLMLRQRQTGTAVANLIRKMGMEKEVFATSFNFWSVWWLKRADPELESGFIYSPTVPVNAHVRYVMERLTGATSSNLSLHLCNEKTIRQLHREGLAVGAWTVFSQNGKWLGKAIALEEELTMIRDLTRWGVDYFITDDPIKLRDFLATLWTPAIAWELLKSRPEVIGAML